jgi:NADH-quinone oxidoreductase subunit A
MNPFYNNFLPILIAFLFSFLLSLIIFGFSIFLAFQRPDTDKLSVYECGFDPYDDARNTFDIKFYLIAILFVIFDLETMFVFSWGVSLPDVNSNGFWIMFDFMFELLVGYVYVWKTGAFDW